MSGIAGWTSSLPPEWTAGCSGEVFVEAQASYRSPGRFYHTWGHVEACAEALRGMPCEDARAVFLALLFHDAVYVAGHRENERQSADLAVNVLRRHSVLGDEALERIHRMILATRDHQVEESAGRDLRVVIDIDMSILGAPWPAFCAYAKGVRDEYTPAAATPARFAAGRIAFLSKLLDQRAIFHTPEGLARWEVAARANIAREIGELEANQGWVWRAAGALLRRMGR